MRRNTLSSFTVSFSIWFSFNSLSQQFLAVMNPPLHRRQWNSHKRRNAVQRHPAQKAQSQRHRVIRRKTLERRDHFLVTFLLRQGLRQRLNLFEQRFVERYPFTHLRRFALTKPQSAMTCYRRQPCRKLPWLFDARQRFEGQEQ